MAWALLKTIFNPSSNDITSAATKADNSPKECPATISDVKPSVVNPIATLCKNTAGCVTLVSF